MIDVEETLNRIASRRGVLGVLVLNRDGTPIKSTLTRDQTRVYAAHLAVLVKKARETVRDLDGGVMVGLQELDADGIMVAEDDGDDQEGDDGNRAGSEPAGGVDGSRRQVQTNELTFLRVRTRRNEIMIAPDKDYTLIVIQNPAEH